MRRATCIQLNFNYEFAIRVVALHICYNSSINWNRTFAIVTLFLTIHWNNPLKILCDKLFNLIRFPRKWENGNRFIFFLFFFLFKSIFNAWNHNNAVKQFEKDVLWLPNGEQNMLINDSMMNVQHVHCLYKGWNSDWLKMY